MKANLVLAVAIAPFVAPTVAMAQQAAPAATGQRAATPAPRSTDVTEGDDGEIVVTGSRNLPGSVVGDIQPEQQLGPADIRSYGVSSVAELLTALSPQTRSGRGSGAPVVLVNGRRVAGFSEIRNLPTEAILRVDILPEEVALKYGFAADQRVVNFVLRPRFRAVTLELEGTAATDGGRTTPNTELDLLKITQKGRINLHLEYNESSALTEAERGVRSATSPFSIAGNVVAPGGGAIDPRLTAAGVPATIAGVPLLAAGGAPSLADFAATAGQPTVTDPTPFRTLLPAARSFGANATYSRSLSQNVSATLNATLDANDSRGAFGLSTVALVVPSGNPFSPFANSVVVDRALSGDFSPLRQRTRTLAGHFGATLNGSIKKWQWSLIGSYDRTDNQTFTDTGIDASGLQGRITANDRTANPFGPVLLRDVAISPATIARSITDNADVDGLINGTIFKLPAGGVATAIRVGASTIGFNSETVRGLVASTANLNRGSVNGQINIDVPIANRAKHVLGAIGTLSANVNYALNRLSDFGTLRTLGYGLNWQPVEPIRIIASTTERTGAPTPQQLGNPLITTPNVRLFDFVRGENALVTTVSGGNAGLAAQRTRTRKFEVALKPWSQKDINFTANYVDVRNRGAISSFPSATAAIEAAFPSRFTRDNSGRLLAIDTRSINFAETSRSELRSGINFSVPIKSKIQKQLEAFREGRGPNPFAGLQRPGGLGQQGQGGPGGLGARGFGGPGGPGGPPGAGGFRGGGFGGGGAGGGRAQFAVYHTLHLTDRVLVQNGLPALDLLRGDTIGGGGGQPRHEIEVQAGYNNNGLGARVSANWQSETTVLGGTALTPDTLRFGSIGTADLRLFADLGQRLEFVKTHRWARGMRILFAVNNVFNTRQRVTDATGATPINFQSAFRDPLGRTVRLSIRKLFF
ncbi:MAG: TonB-dependent receptor [Sphingomonas sp.]